MHRFLEWVSIAILCFGNILLIGLQMHLYGWILVAIGMLLLTFCRKEFKKHVFLLYICTIFLGLTPITTNISYSHIVQMTIPLGLAIVVPFAISTFLYKDKIVRFTFNFGRKWHKMDFFYILIVFMVAYLSLPFMLFATGSYKNWTVEPEVKNLVVLFLGTQALGIWDELFFVSTALGIFRKYFHFFYANLFQAVLMTAFLFELGFRGWMFLFVFIFSFMQGYVFKKTESLFYVIVIHLILDLVLYLALLHLYYPHWPSAFFM